MSIPSSEDVRWGTLERCLRDTVWARCDARASTAPELRTKAEFLLVDDALARSMDALAALMKTHHVDRWTRFSKRLEAHLGHVNSDQAAMVPKVVNRHHYRNEAGEPDATLLPVPYLYVGRGTPLGNPYTVKEHGPKAIDLYKVHLWDKLKSKDEGVLASMASIQWDTHLVCSCAPRSCHADVVLAAWLWLQRQAWWSEKLYET